MQVVSGGGTGAGGLGGGGAVGGGSRGGGSSGGYDPRTGDYNPAKPSIGDRIIDAIKDICIPDNPCPPCNPPAGEKFKKVTHMNTHSMDADKGSHGCMQKTGSPVHWHYDVMNQNKQTCQCFQQQHVFGGCGMAPPN